MRKILRMARLLVMGMMGMMGVMGAAGQEVVTANVTLGGGTTNGFTLTVNGQTRTFVDSWTAGTSQLPVGTNSSMASSNILVGYGAYPLANMFVSRPATNVIRYQSYPGYVVTVSLAGGLPWGTVAYSTNTITAATVMRAPFSVAGNYEKTNVATAIAQYLGDASCGYVIPADAGALANFVPPDVAGLTNFCLTLSTNGTNFALGIGLANSNYTAYVARWATNIFNTFGDAVYHYAYEFQPASEVLSNIATLGTLQGLSYIEAGTGNILLSNTNGVERLRAYEDGRMQLSFEDGQPQFYALGSSSSYRFYLRDHGTVNRLDLRDSVADNGITYLRSGAANDAILIDGTNGAVHMDRPPSFSLGGSLNTALMGTVANFFASAQNSGGSDTDADSYTVPASVMLKQGDAFTRTVGVKLAANSNAKKIQVSFNANPIMTVAGVTLSGGFISLSVTVTRSSGSTYSYTGTATTGASTPGTAGDAYASAGTASGVDFGSSMAFKLILTGTDTGDLEVVLDRIEFKPSELYAY